MIFCLLNPLLRLHLLLTLQYRHHTHFIVLQAPTHHTRHHIVFSLIPHLHTLHLHHYHCHTDTSHGSHFFTPHTTSSPTPSTSSTTANSSFNTYNTPLLQLFAIHSLTSVTDSSVRFPPSLQAMLLNLSQSPFCHPNLLPLDQMTVSEFSHAILAQLFQHFHTSAQ